MVAPLIVAATIIAGSRIVSSIFGLGTKRSHRARSAAEFSDLQIPTTQINQPIPIYFGRHKVGGNYIWVGNKFVEPRREKSSGAVWLEWWYKADFAIGLGEGPIRRVKDIWFADKVAYELENITTTRYLGTALQTAPQLLADTMVDPPTFRNTAYIFGSGDLGNQNALPDTEVEIEGLVITGSDVIPGLADWILKASAATGTARYQQGFLSFSNKLWIFGGSALSSGFLNDVYSSTDGVTWTQKTASANWSKRYAFSAEVFLSKMWVIGGEAANGTYLGDVWSSTDGITWTQSTLSGDAWAPRFGHTSVVFNSKLWIIGGRDDTTFYSDIFSSTDGAAWTKETATSTWASWRFSARANHASVVFDNKIWVFGGWDGVPKDDIWFSSNGKDWNKVAAPAPWGQRFGHSTVVHDGKIWLMGGEGPAGVYYGDVWYSSDGITWAKAYKGTGRHGLKTASYNSKIWLSGGYTGSLKDDVWSFSPPSYFPGDAVTNPAYVIREYLTNKNIGLGLPTTILDTASFDDAADYCDDIVTSYSLRSSSFTQSSDLDEYDVTQANGTVTTDSGLKMSVTAADKITTLEARSQFVLIGDFDIECEWEIIAWTWKDQGDLHEAFHMGITDSNDSHIWIYRYQGQRFGGMEAGYDWYPGTGGAGYRGRGNFSAENNWLSGFWRIKRENEKVYLYYKQNSTDQWTLHNGGGKDHFKYHASAVRLVFGYKRFYAVGAIPTTVRIKNWTQNSSAASSIRRFQLDYAVADIAPAMDHLDNMLACFGGFLVYSNGKIKLEVDRPKASSYAFTESNILAGSLTWSQITPLNERPSHVRIEYVDGKAGYRFAYAEASFDFQQEQHGYKQDEVSLPGIREYDQAWRMAQYYLRLKQYVNLACTFATGPEGLQLDPGDIITVTHSGPGWTAKEFRVIKLQYGEDDTVIIDATDFSPSIFELPKETPPLGADFLTNISILSYPSEISRFVLVEHFSEPWIIIAFSLKGDVAFFGVQLYKELNLSGNWEPVARLTRPTVTALIYTAISATATSIEIYSIEGYQAVGTFLPFPAVIDSEIVSVTAFNATTMTLTVQRGIWGSVAASHAADSIIWRALDVDYYVYTVAGNEQGQQMRFKAYALDRQGNEVQSGTIYSATTTIRGISKQPAPPDLLQINSKGNDVSYAGGDMVVSWQKVNKFAWGYGLIEYGQDNLGYGGGVLPDWEQDHVWIKADGTIVRQVRTTDTSYTYTEALNIADNGSLRKDLTIEVRSQVANYLSEPATITTTS